jgi:uncharacterized protein (DUF1697 family)
MAALKACFEAQGFGDVATYIQSGNVVFSATTPSTSRIERALAATFGYQAVVVVRSARQMREIVDGAPAGFGKAPARFRYDVMFLRDSLTAAAALKQIKVREGVDAAYAGKGVLYVSRLIAKASQSRMAKIISLPIYKEMTIRNWNTTTKLLALLEA